MKNTLFIEETLPDRSYQVVWRGTGDIDKDAPAALRVMSNWPVGNRLELWSRAWAESHKGFAPMAFRKAGGSAVAIGNTLKMLMGGS